MNHKLQIIKCTREKKNKKRKHTNIVKIVWCMIHVIKSTENEREMATEHSKFKLFPTCSHTIIRSVRKKSKKLVLEAGLYELKKNILTFSFR